MSLRTIKQAGVIAVAVIAVASCMATASQAAQNITVAKNHTLRVALSAPAGSVIIGNPDIADVSIVDSRTVYIIGKGFGNSAINITDRMGHSLFDGEVAVTSEVKGGITIYRGLTPSVIVCDDVCTDGSAKSSAVKSITLTSTTSP